MKRKQRISAIFIMIGFIICMMNIFYPVSAAQTEGSITLNCIKDGRILSDMQWQLYDVGDIKGNKFEWSDIFSPYSGEIAAGERVFSVTSSVANFASTLKNYTVTEKLPPAQVQTTDAAGRVTFSGLRPTGMYLLTANDKKIKEYSWSTEPMLYTFDGTATDLELYPKIIATLDANMYSVRKVWKHTKSQEEKVKYVTIRVARYCDGEYVDTVELNEANEWTASWMGEVGEEWVVKEVEIPEFYTVVYRKWDTEYIVENTYQRPNGSSWFEWEESEETTTTLPGSWMTDTDQPESSTYPAVFTEGTGTATTPPAGHDSQSVPTETTKSTDRTATASSGTGTETRTTGTETSGTQTSGTETVGTGTRTTGTETTGTETTGTKTGVSRVGSDAASQDTSNSTRTTVPTTTKTTSSGSGSGNSGNGSGNPLEITKLPQTGQLWWPVPPLACGGILMMGIGIKIGKKDDDDE